jgi:ComEC/Rec2-related protein
MHRYTAITLFSWISGLIIMAYVAQPPWFLLLTPLLGMLFVRKDLQICLLLCCISIIAGALRMQYHTYIPEFESSQVHNVQMMVQDQKNTWKHQKILLKDTQHRQFIAQIPLSPQVTRGMVVTINADLMLWPLPHSQFHHELQRKRIIGELHNLELTKIDDDSSVIAALEQGRQYFWTSIHSSFPEPIASVVTGMLLGIAGDVDPVTAEAFRRSGTSHILVISGWNITIVAALCLAIINALKPSRRVALIVPLVVITLYVLFTGASAAVVRAGVMGSILVIGRWLDRPRSMPNIIAVALMLITVVDPAAIWDMGMQLSTLATIGLVCFATPIEHYLTRTILQSTYLNWAREGLASTIAAQITTFPIMFCRLELPTIWSLLANTIITPVVPVAMACGTLFLVATLIHPTVAQLIAWIAYPSFAWIVTGSQVIATWPVLISLPSMDVAPWFELCLHACWIGGWILWRKHTTLLPNPTPIP